MQPIKVMHIITGLGTGGAEAMLYKLLNQQGADNRVDNIVVSLTPGGKHHAMLEEKGIRVITLNVKKVWLLPVYLWRLLSAIKQEKIQIINAWMYHAMLFACLLSLFSLTRGPRLLWNVRHSLQNLNQEKPSIRLIIRLLGLLLVLPERVVFNSQKSALEHQKYWNMKDKAQFIANGFELSTWLPKRELADTTQDPLRALLNIEQGRIIGNVGRAHPMKNQLGLIKHFLALADKYPNAHLVVIGKGTDALPIPDIPGKSRIHLLGERNDVNVLMPFFDYFVLSSNWGEGFPNVLGEAMACELVCLTNDVGDSGYLLNDADWIVPPYQDKALESKLGELLDLDAAQCSVLGKTHRQRMQEHFSIEAISEQYLDLYHSLCSLNLQS
ncbi:glycosyltransferase [Alteromonas sp. a30]|uniref:glycosyltransferase n=1 Tax=Alteromonas sp. a30 TaxID=2730917 RepID=UPI002281D5D1|nr:glycosyltransferase [Alteromonas sp. a30]MCY7294346.1 glycosyltransferase [Alteromonas sp. a30]